MQTIILEEPGRFALTETQAPVLNSMNEALVRVCRVGICGTDMHAYRGRQPFFSYPRILGHELGVEIVEIGKNEAGLKVGDRCAVEPYLNCGECIACRRGKTNCCARLQVLGVHTDGGMREVIAVPINKLHKSDKLSLEQLALVETLGIGAHANERAQITPGEFVLVIGAGPIGLSVMQFAKIGGGRVIALDVNPNRLRFCREQMGVEHTVQAGDDTLDQLKAITNGDLPTVVFEATGSPQSMNQSFQFVASGGKLILVSIVQADITFHDPEFHRKEMTLLSSRNATRHEFTRIIRLMEEGTLDTTPWITHRAPADTLLSVFPEWLTPEQGVIKAMVTFGK